MKFIDVQEKLPEEYVEPHKHMLWILTEKYGPMSGFYYKGKFMKDYACEILNVIGYIELPM